MFVRWPFIHPVIKETYNVFFQLCNGEVTVLVATM